MRGKRELPNHIHGTIREWKARKRAEWRRVDTALNKFMQGCAHTPAYQDYLALAELAKRIRKSLSEKEWGR